jgi:hypothetical protein
MLPLDDPRWHELWTSYSRASEFLPALQRLWDNPATYHAVLHEFALENHVCHQFSVYHTTLAVVPHFVHAAGRLPPKDRGELLTTAGFYALLLGVPLQKNTPDLPVVPPSYLEADYDRAVQAAIPLTCEALAVPPSGADPEQSRLQLMAGLAGFHGQRRVGVLLNRVVGWVECSRCEAEFEPLEEWGEDF